MYALSVELTKW